MKKSLFLVFCYLSVITPCSAGEAPPDERDQFIGLYLESSALIIHDLKLCDRIGTAIDVQSHVLTEVIQYTGTQNIGTTLDFLHIKEKAWDALLPKIVSDERICGPKLQEYVKSWTTPAVTRILVFKSHRFQFLYFG